MDLASYYQDLFNQISAQHEDPWTNQVNIDGSSPFSLGYDHPHLGCDLDALHEEEIYSPFNASCNDDSYFESSPQTPFYCSGLLVEPKTSTSPPHFSQSFVQNCPFDGEVVVEDSKLSPGSPTRSSPTTSTRSTHTTSTRSIHTTSTRSSPVTSTGSTPSSSTRGKPQSTKSATRSRSKANARERKRMRRINVGFQELRLRLPGRSLHKELSKMEAIQVAHSYIIQLATILQSSV